VAEHPYRAGHERVEGPRVVVAEPERPPRRVRVRAWTDRTTRIRLRAAGQLLARVGFGFLTLLFALAGDAERELSRGVFGYALAVVFAVLTLRTFRAEQITVSPAAVSRRRWLRRAEVRLLADVSTVVVTGSGEETRLDLQIGRERLQLAAGLGYDEMTLRWIAKRLRRALEAAR
jgi:hypothetical protein